MDVYYGQQPKWSKCRDGFECTTIQVPLDYAKPSGERIGLSVIRKPAKRRSRRIGSLVTNPGGPGGSGVEFLRQAATAFGAELQARFDLVGFDPRGVGGSAPVECLSDDELDDFVGTDTSPDDRSEIDELVAEGKEFAAGCQEHYRERLPHVGTLNAARDMDVLRAALGDRKLTYYGASYGTYLGAFYAEQFPKNVRALVLDGAVDPSLSSAEILIEQAQGFETALRAFATDCAQGQGCPLGDDADEVIDTIAALQRRVDRKPLKNGTDDRIITDSWTTMGIAAALYVKQNWPMLRLGLIKAIEDGEGDTLLYLADQLIDRDRDGYSNQTEANMAVNCIDKPSPPDAAAYQKEVDKAAKVAPNFGPFVMWGGLPCVYWPVKPETEPKALAAQGAAPIVVVGTTRDPATPYKWAQKMASQLDSGVLLTLNGDGHTAYLQGNSCIMAATDNYLIELTAPKEGTVCR